MLIYLDVCCLNRPFDDQFQGRIRLESEAVLTILNGGEKEKWRLLNSEAIEFEISAIPEEERKKKVAALTAIAQEKTKMDEKIKLRARELEKIGIKAYDALHLACAEYGGAEVFLTTDDKLLRKAKRNRNKLKIRVENPVLWLMEVTKSERSSNEP
ncbi:MAG: PIN domain-containing protein [Bacillota bacterium]